MSLTAAPSHTFSIADEQNIGMLPPVSECTVAQAAWFLEGTEGLVNELLDAGLITSRLEDGKHLIQWDSLVGYRQERKRRHAVLDEMVRMNQEMGLYDD